MKVFLVILSGGIITFSIGLLIYAVRMTVSRGQSRHYKQRREELETERKENEKEMADLCNYLNRVRGSDEWNLLINSDLMEKIVSILDKFADETPIRVVKLIPPPFRKDFCSRLEIYSKSSYILDYIKKQKQQRSV